MTALIIIGTLLCGIAGWWLTDWWLTPTVLGRVRSSS